MKKENIFCWNFIKSFLVLDGLSSTGWPLTPGNLENPGKPWIWKCPWKIPWNPLEWRCTPGKLFKKARKNPVIVLLKHLKNVFMNSYSYFLACGAHKWFAVEYQPSLVPRPTSSDSSVVDSLRSSCRNYGIAPGKPENSPWKSPWNTLENLIGKAVATLFHLSMIQVLMELVFPQIYPCCLSVWCWSVQDFLKNWSLDKLPMELVFPQIYHCCLSGWCWSVQDFLKNW